MDATKEKTQPGISQYIPLGWLRISAIPAMQNESVAPWDNMNRETSHRQGCFLRSSPTARITVMSHSKPPTARNSIPSDLSDWYGAKPKVQTKRTPINRARASAARPGTPGYSRILLRLIETATKIRPASVAAAPVSALRKLDQPAVTFKLGRAPSYIGHGAAGFCCLDCAHQIARPSARRPGPGQLSCHFVGLLEERQQILVDHVLVSGAHAVGITRIDFQGRSLDDLR